MLNKLLFFIVFMLLITIPTDAAQSPESKIRAAEAQLRGLPTEHAIVFNPAGDIVARFDAGTANDVRISVDGFEGDIMTHNHTIAETLSTADVDNAVKMNLSQLRVVEPNGITCVLSARSGHPFVDFTLDDSYPYTIGVVGEEDFNWNGVWRRYAALNGLQYGCFGSGNISISALYGRKGIN